MERVFSFLVVLSVVCRKENIDLMFVLNARLEKGILQRKNSFNVDIANDGSVKGI